MSSKVKIGSASRSSTDLSYFNREVKHRAQPPARGGRASAVRRDRRWASRSSELRRWRQPSGSATGTGAVLAALVDGRACSDVGGAGALLSDIADKQYCRKLRASLPCPFFAHGGVAFDGDCGAASQTRCVAGSGPLGAVRQTSMHRPPDPRRARKPTSGAVVPLNRVRTGGGRGASVPRPPGAGVPGWFGPGRQLGPPVALPH